MRKAIKIFDAFLAVVCAVVLIMVALGNYLMPDNYIVYGGNYNQPSKVYSYSQLSQAQSVDYQNSTPSRQTLNLLGVIPVKNVTVTNKPLPQVYVSGEAFGIKLYTDGVIVVGTQNVDVDGKQVNPAKDAGIRVGDVIVAINNVNVYTSSDVTEILNDNNGEPYTLKIKRDDRYRTFVLSPAYSKREGLYKAGMWVRDSTAGIGTITFYNKESGTFAALGHQVNDVDTNEIMPLLEGEAVGAEVTDVQKGSTGSTGSLCCEFQDYTIGRLIENSYCGIYGSYTAVPEKCKAYTVASKQEVKRGDAKILCTLSGNEIKEYDVKITKINYSSNGEKDIVFKVTDDELISKTGGIVQGMSGSPIIQNNMLVGAVTHVIVNNPEKGYAIFAETMLEESNAEK